MLVNKDFLLSKFSTESTGVEIGVWKGDFSKKILELVQPKMLYLCDPWEFIPKYEDRPYNECSAETFLHGGEADDHALSVCLSSMGIYPAYTRDDMGRERFLHFNPSEHVFDARNEPGWYTMFSFTPHLPRSGCCS